MLTFSKQEHLASRCSSFIHQQSGLIPSFIIFLSSLPVGAVFVLCGFFGPNFSSNFIPVNNLSCGVNYSLAEVRAKQIMFPRVFSKNRPGFIFSANLCCELVIRRRASGPINTAHWSVLPGGGARQRRSSEWTTAACDTGGRDDVSVLSAFLYSVMMLFFFPGVVNVVF